MYVQELAVRIELSEHVITIRPTATITADYVIRLLTWLYDEADYRNRNDLWDFRGLSLVLDYEGMRKIAAFTRESRGTDWKQRNSALVVEGDLFFGFARMYETLTDGGDFEVGIFSDIDEARVWLEEHPPKAL